MKVSEVRQFERLRVEELIDENLREVFPRIVEDIQKSNDWTVITIKELKNKYNLVRIADILAATYRLKGHPNIICKFSNYEIKSEDIGRTVSYEYKYVSKETKEELKFDQVAYKNVTGSKLMRIKEAFKNIHPVCPINDLLAVADQLLLNDFQNDWQELSPLRYSAKAGMEMKSFIKAIDELVIRRLVIIKEYTPNKIIKYRAKFVLNPEDYKEIYYKELTAQGFYNYDVHLNKEEYENKNIDIKEVNTNDENTKSYVSNELKEHNNDLSNLLIDNNNDIGTILIDFQDRFNKMFSLYNASIVDKLKKEKVKEEESYVVLCKLMKENKSKDEKIKVMTQECTRLEKRLKAYEKFNEHQKVVVKMCVNALGSRIIGTVANFLDKKQYEIKSMEVQDKLRSDIMNYVLKSIEDIDTRMESYMEDQKVPNLLK